MVNATCGTCGAQLQFDDVAVPPSGKITACEACGAQVTVMPPGATAMGVPEPVAPGQAPKRSTMAGLGSALPPATQEQLYGGSSNRAVDEFGDGGAFADLPMPKRSSPFAGIEARPGAEQRSPLEGVEGRARGPSHSPLEGIADLPAPKRAADGFTDLPMPKRDADAEGVDLPAPVGPTPTRGDLPAPKGFFDDVPAPKSTVGGLGAAVAPAGDNVDLPAPKGFFDDVPAPKSTVGGFDAAPLSQPGEDGLDLPAPKGFFDDVPAPKSTVGGLGDAFPPADQGLDLADFGGEPPSVPAPGAEGDALDLPPPGGFFGDASIASTESAFPPPPSAPAQGGDGNFDLPEPSGFFAESAPAPAPSPPAARPPAAGSPDASGVLDLDDLDLEPSRMGPLPTADRPNAGPGALDGPGGPSGIEPFDLGADGGGGGQPSLSLDLDDGGAGRGAGGAGGAGAHEPLDLGGDMGAPPSLDDMDLEKPSTGAGAGLGVVTFNKPSDEGRARGATGAPPRSAGQFGAPQETGLELDVDGPSGGAVPGLDAPPVARATAVGTLAADQDEVAADANKARRRKLMVAAIAAVVVLLGVGGFMFIRWQAQQEEARNIALTLEQASNALAADRWAQAANAAEKVLTMAPGNEDARGLAAQAYYASAIDRCDPARKRIGKAEAHFQKLQESGGKAGPEAQKAKGLRQITEGNGPEAVVTLRKLSRGAGKDTTALLYLAWALATEGRQQQAVEAYQAALKQAPNRLPALYGMGLSHLELGQVKEARTAFLGVLERDKNHIGAQVGLAQIVDVARYNDRELRYLEILQRKNLDQADPCAVSLAWALAGDEALRAGRIDESRARYVKALELDPNNIPAMVGESKAALAMGKTDEARDRLGVVLKQRPNDVEALVVFAQASLSAKATADARKSIEQAIELAPTDWRAHMVYGEILENEPEADLTAAEDAYRQAAELSDDSEVAPLIALSKLLIKLGRGGEARNVLEAIEAAAETDAPLAVTLCVAYLGTGDASRAELWCRKALERRAGDTEAMLQLGLALMAQGRNVEAIDVLRSAYDTDRDREDIGVRLVLAFERDGNDEGAARTCEMLLERPNASINVLGRCGRYYARIGRVEKACELGEKVLAENDRNAAGHFLRGECLQQAGDHLEAQKEFRQAVSIDEQAQYYEALGRATEAQQLFDEALKAFKKASALDPQYFAPRLGRTRIRVARREFTEAISELEAAQKLEDDSALVYYYLGQARYEMGEHAAAAAALNRATKLNDELAHAFYLLGMANFDIGNKERAASTAFATATKLAEGTEAWLPEAFRLLGMTLRIQRRSCEAARAFRNFLDIAKPGSAEAKDARRMQLEMDARCR